MATATVCTASARNLLYKKEYEINDFIKIRIPTVGEVIDHEAEYYSLVFTLTAMPIDMMVQLDDAGIDFTQIDEYDLFLLLFQVWKTQDVSMVFGDLDISGFELMVNDQNGNMILRDNQRGITIDRAIYEQIAGILRRIHHLEQNLKKPGNEEAKKFMIKRARDKMKRRKNKDEDSPMESLVIAMVNTEQYKYDFEGTRNLTIYQFNESVRQIIHKVNYENLMRGVYAGTVETKELSQDAFNWLARK